MIEFLKIKDNNYNVVDEDVGLVGKIVFDEDKFWLQPESDIDFTASDLEEISNFMYKIGYAKFGEDTLAQIFKDLKEDD